jgi:hypothetical protein
VQAGDVCLFHGRGVEVVSTRMIGEGWRRRRRVVYRAPDARLVFEDFEAGDWVVTLVVSGS